MKRKQYLVIVEFAEGSNYSAYVPDLPGCVAAADTRQECLKLMGEAIALHIRGMLEDGDPIPEPTTESAYVEPAYSDPIEAVA